MNSLPVLGLAVCVAVGEQVAPGATLQFLLLFGFRFSCDAIATLSLAVVALETGFKAVFAD